MDARLRQLWRRILFLIRVRRNDHDIDAEIAAHLEIAAENLRLNGMDAESARRTAAREFGSRVAVKEHAREQRTFPGVESFFKDIVHALSLMRAHPRFALAAIGLLGLSIGTNMTVVTLVNAALFKGYPQVERNDRLLYLTMDPECCVSYPTFEDWRSIARSFQEIAAVRDGVRAFSDGDDSPRTYFATEITSNTFRLVGRQPVLGRDFTHADELEGAQPVVILSYPLWDQRYHRNPSVIGRTVHLNGQITTIIGVMPKGFSFPQNQDIWLPMIPTAALRNRSNAGAVWFVIGRLKDGVSIESARVEMRTIGQGLRTEYPDTGNILPLVRTFPEFFIRTESIRLYQTMLGAVSFLVLIACANLASLLMARSVDRSRELATRLALGASRGRIIRQLLVESVLLSAPGGVLGWCIANFGIRLYAHFANGAGLSDVTGVWFANIIDFSMDTRVLLYLVAISLGTGVLFGLLPALRLSKPDIQRALKDGGWGATGGMRSQRLSMLLVVGQTALTVVLLAGSATMVRSFLRFYNADLGFNPSRELLMALVLPKRYTAQETVSFADRLKGRLEAIPGIEAVAVADARPWLPRIDRTYEVSDVPVAAAEDVNSLPKTSWTNTTPDYFRSLGLSMLYGRDFNDADNATGNPVAIVNRQFAAAAWPHQSAIGKHLRFVGRNRVWPWMTVIGIAPDIAHGGFNHPLYRFLPQVYLPYRQSALGMIWVQALTRLPPASLANSLYRELHSIDPAIPLSLTPQSMAENLNDISRYRGAISILFSIFALVALLLASFGLYSVVAHAVSRRTQEIGVRIALGATLVSIFTLVCRQTMISVGCGLAVGLVAAVAVNRVLATFITGVLPFDLIPLADTAAILILCAGAGCLIPAVRAARNDPAKAIRYE